MGSSEFEEMEIFATPVIPAMSLEQGHLQRKGGLSGFSDLLRDQGGMSSEEESGHEKGANYQWVLGFNELD